MGTLILTPDGIGIFLEFDEAQRLCDQLTPMLTSTRRGLVVEEVEKLRNGLNRVLAVHAAKEGEN